MSAEVYHYFPNLSAEQKYQIEGLKPLYINWNSKINVISRKDMEAFYVHHVLHSLAIAHYWSPESGDCVLDIGTGGGFPGIPLAILRPDLSFLLVDSIGKKIKVVNDVVSKLGLTNVRAVHDRAENISGTFQIAVTRAVAKLSTLTKICTTNKKLKVGRLYCLKGGDLEEELAEVDHVPLVDLELKNRFKEEFFETKKLVLAAF